MAFDERKNKDFTTYIKNELDTYGSNKVSNSQDIPLDMTDKSMDILFSNKVKERGTTAGKTSGYLKLFQSLENIEKFAHQMDPQQIVDTGSIKESPTDENNRIIIDYDICAQCGKKLTKPSKDGFCSAKCQWTYKLKVLAGELGQIQDIHDNILKKITAAAKLGNILLKFLSELASDLTSLPGLNLDDPYMVFFKVYISRLQVYVKYNMNKVLIWKNNILIQKLQEKKNGIDKASDTAIQALNIFMKSINQAIDATKMLNEKFNEAYQKVYKVVVESLVPFRLEPESLSFGSTARSLMIFPEKMANPLLSQNITNSIVDSIDFDKIYKFIDLKLPAIKEYEYLLDPKIFKVRKALSDYNSNAAMKMIEPLIDLMKPGAEPLPKYEKLKITNIHWLIFLLNSWGPYGIIHYAYPLPWP